MRISTIPFDVNDTQLRKTFFDQLLAERISGLGEHASPLWGNMTAQHMVEHLLWAFECSTGAIVLPCCTPENLLERTKTFLYDNRPTPRGFKNPLLGQSPPSLRFSCFSDAKAALHKEVSRFIDLCQMQTNTRHVHPVFGPIGAEEWQRAHFKHCYHHLLQFGVVEAR